MTWQQDAKQSWRDSRVRLRDRMSAFVHRQTGRTKAQRVVAASKALETSTGASQWSERNIRKAMEDGHDDWLPRTEALVVFCEVADVSLTSLLSGDGTPRPFIDQFADRLAARVSELVGEPVKVLDGEKIFEELAAAQVEPVNAHKSAIERRIPTLKMVHKNFERMRDSGLPAEARAAQKAEASELLSLMFATIRELPQSAVAKVSALALLNAREEESKSG